MTRSVSTWVLLAVVGALLAGCTAGLTKTPTQIPEITTVGEPAAPANTQFGVVDALGREVIFQQPPRRIVLAGRALFMIADALYLFPGAPQRIAGMGQTNQGSGNFISLIDPEYEAKAVLDRDAGAEQIAPLKPDVVILKSSLAETLGSSMEALGVPVVYVDFETPEQYTRDLQILGALLQDTVRAGVLASLYQERLDLVNIKISGLQDIDKPRTLLIYTTDDEGGVAFNVPPMGWIQTRLVELAGGVPVWGEANLGKGWTTVTLEQIAAWDADAIFVVSYQSDPSDVTAALISDPNWQLLRAVQQEHLYAFAYDQFSWDQPDPRWILGLQWMAGKLHPDLFADMNMVDEARRFYQDFYGLDTAFFEEHIRPTFKGDLP